MQYKDLRRSSLAVLYLQEGEHQDPPHCINNVPSNT